MDDLHLPWTNDKLEELLLQVIKTGETTKVDFKSAIDLSKEEQKAELVKDISAFANTYDFSYRNHGFIILGVADNKLKHCDFPQAADAFQATVDDLIRRYVEPFVPTHLRIFDAEGIKWGVIVVPPTKRAPHIFVKDIHKRYRGDIYVRRGTITDKALPEDFPRFFRLHLDEQTYDLQQQIKELQREVGQLTTSLSTMTAGSASQSATLVEDRAKAASRRSVRKHDLLQQIEAELAEQADPIADGLVNEVLKINALIDSSEIPWALQVVSKESGAEILDKLESTASSYWAALARLVERDDAGKYDDAVVASLQYLGRQLEAPSGTSYTELGVSVRYYPLLVSLYIVFVLGAFKTKARLLKRVQELKLTRRSYYDEPLSISYVLFYARRAGDIFQTRRADYPAGKWCDAVATVVRDLLQKRFTVTAPSWDFDTWFFSGEFLLSLTPLASGDVGHPAGGLFYYFNSSEPIVRRFLSRDVAWIATVFHKPLKEILRVFDETAGNLARGSGCFGDGFQSGAVKTAFPEATAK